jgi:hypothetical protein
MLATDTLRFEEAPTGEPFSLERVGRGLSAGDLDGDGAPDLVVTNSVGPLSIGLNRLPAHGSWLGVRLFQPSTPTRSNTAAIGAKLTLTLDSGQAQVRWIRSGTGYLSQDDLGQLFGIPEGTTPTDLEVRWPDGAVQSLSPGEPGHWMRVERL